jgi:outer membrane protein
MHHHGRVSRARAARSRIGLGLAILLILGGSHQVARCVPPVRGPASGAADPRSLPPRASTTPASSSFALTTEMRGLLADEAQVPSARPPEGGATQETLDEAWAIALAVDQQLEARRWEVSSAEQLQQSAQAQRWPTVAVEGSYEVRSDEPSFRFGFPGVPLPTSVFPYAQDENFAFRTKVDLPLYTSGRIRYGIAAADDAVSAAELEVNSSTNDLKLRVAQEYVAVLRAQRDLEVSESNVRSLDAHARDVELLFRHEQVPRNDLLAAQVALSNARQRAIQTANQLDASRAAYNRRLGRPLTSPVQIAELPLEAVEGDVESLTARALRTRPEIARLAVQVRALRNQATSLRAKDRPQFGLWGQYAFEENRFRTPEGIASVGVGVTYDVFDGGRNRHEAAALLQRAESLMRLRADLESMIALEVRRAWLDIQETRRRLEVTSEAIQQAEENLRVARKRYVAGMGISTEVLDAEALRTETRKNRDNAAYDAVLAALRLRHAMGELAP